MSLSRHFILCTAIFIASGLAIADTTWVAEGDVWGNWTLEHSPYIVQGSITVADTSTLAIGSGVRVFFRDSCGLTILGHFRALGTVGDSVVFTSDTTGGTGWAGIVHWQAIPSDTVVLNYCVIENTRNYPGFSALAANSTVWLQSCAIRHCVAGGYGGGMRAECDSCGVDLQDCELAHNQGGVGGGISVFRSTRANLRRCDLHDNRALDGGAVCTSTTRSVTLDSCTIHDNHGTVWGGAVYFNNGPATLRNSILHHNSGLDGGAIMLGGNAEIDHCLLYENEGTNGGAIEVRNGINNSLNNCTLVNNRSNGNGALKMFYYADVRNCVIAFNRGGYGVSTNSQSVQYCAVFGNELGEIQAYNVPGLGQIDTLNANGDSCDVYSNILLNPLFADTAAGDYHLTANSPCIDAGDPTLPFDPDSTIADIGAFYYPHPNKTDRDFIPHPSSFSLCSYPNPFNSSTWIEFDLPKAGNTSLKVFDVLGQEVATLSDGRLSAGNHRLLFNGEGRASGTYVIRMQASGAQQTRKITLVR